MNNATVAHETFTIERVYQAPPERVFSAWADPVQKRRWFAEGEHWTVEAFEVDFREGGLEHSCFRFKDGPVMSNDTFHHEIVRDRRIVSSYTMAIEGRRISVSLSTVTFEPHGSGTRLRFTEQAAFLEGADGPEQRKKGWNVLLTSLERHLAPGT